MGYRDARSWSSFLWDIQTSDSCGAQATFGLAPHGGFYTAGFKSGAPMLVPSNKVINRPQNAPKTWKSDGKAFQQYATHNQCILDGKSRKKIQRRVLGWPLVGLKYSVKPIHWEPGLLWPNDPKCAKKKMQDFDITETSPQEVYRQLAQPSSCGCGCEFGCVIRSQEHTCGCEFGIEFKRRGLSKLPEFAQIIQLQTCNTHFVLPLCALVKITKQNGGLRDGPLVVGFSEILKGVQHCADCLLA